MTYFLYWLSIMTYFLYWLTNDLALSTNWMTQPDQILLYNSHSAAIHLYMARAIIIPQNPGKHWQTKPIPKGWHCPLWRQGSLKHSLIRRNSNWLSIWKDTTNNVNKKVIFFIAGVVTFLAPILGDNILIQTI